MFIETFVEQDYLASLKDGPLSPLTSRPHSFWLLTHYPMFCGEMLFGLQASMQTFGRQLCSWWGTAISVIHLYNTTISIGYTRVEWLDMNALINIHDEKYPFVGGGPKSTYDAAAKFSLAKGIEIQTAIPGRDMSVENAQIRTTKQNDNRKRTLNMVDSLTGLFYDRYWAVQGVDRRPHFLLHRVEEMGFQKPAQNQTYQSNLSGGVES